MALFMTAVVGYAAPSLAARQGSPEPIAGLVRPVRTLPFRLHLDTDARHPQSLREMVDRIYVALPREHADRIAAFFGSRDLERTWGRYRSNGSFYQDLYRTEILDEAFRAWGFDDRYPLDAARRCVGDEFDHQVALRIAIRRMYEARSQPQPAPVRDSSGAYGMADRISRILFAACDRQFSPDRTYQAQP